MFLVNASVDTTLKLWSIMIKSLNHGQSKSNDYSQNWLMSLRSVHGWPLLVDGTIVSPWLTIASRWHHGQSMVGLCQNTGDLYW